jgi:hypothetical protein
MVVVTVFGILLIAGNGPWSRPRLLLLTDGHGIHIGDLAVLAGWLAAACSGIALWRRA